MAVHIFIEVFFREGVKAFFSGDIFNGSMD